MGANSHCYECGNCADAALGEDVAPTSASAKWSSKRRCEKLYPRRSKKRIKELRRFPGKGMGALEQKTNDIVSPDSESSKEHEDLQRTTYASLQPHFFSSTFEKMTEKTRNKLTTLPASKNTFLDLHRPLDVPHLDERHSHAIPHSRER